MVFENFESLFCMSRLFYRVIEVYVARIFVFYRNGTIPVKNRSGCDTGIPAALQKATRKPQICSDSSDTPAGVLSFDLGEHLICTGPYYPGSAYLSAGALAPSPYARATVLPFGETLTYPDIS